MKKNRILKFKKPNYKIMMLMSLTAGAVYIITNAGRFFELLVVLIIMAGVFTLYLAEKKQNKRLAENLSCAVLGIIIVKLLWYTDGVFESVVSILFDNTMDSYYYLNEVLYLLMAAVNLSMLVIHLLVIRSDGKNIKLIAINKLLIYVIMLLTLIWFISNCIYNMAFYFSEKHTWYVTLCILRDGAFAVFSVYASVIAVSTEEINSEHISAIASEEEDTPEENKMLDADKIFLLSIEEYEKYMGDIPEYDGKWWLRSSNMYDDSVAFAYGSSQAGDYDYGERKSCYGVRPVLKIDNSDNLHIKDRFEKYNITWVLIDTDLAIAEKPVTEHIFDEITNDYAKSAVRQYLINWLKDHDKAFALENINAALERAIADCNKPNTALLISDESRRHLAEWLTDYKKLL